MMPEISLTGVLPVAAIAFLMPLVLGLVPLCVFPPWSSRSWPAS